MKTSHKILGVIAAIIIIGLVWYVSSKPGIVIDRLEGEVLVNGNPAEQGMKLNQADTIATKDGRAELLIYDSSIVRLDAHTELELATMTASKLGFTQLAGRTWTKLVKLSGIDEYSIQAPDAVATVRGTAFAVKIVDGETHFSTTEGTVEIATDDDKMMVEQAHAATAAQKKLAKAEYVLDDWHKGNIDKDHEHIERVKKRLREKYRRYIKIAKSQYDATDEQVEQALEDRINGKLKMRDLLMKRDRLREARQDMEAEQRHTRETAEAARDTMQRVDDQVARIEREQERMEEVIDSIDAEIARDQVIDEPVAEPSDEPVQESQDEPEPVMHDITDIIREPSREANDQPVA